MNSMSQPASPHTQRTYAGMAGAMIVVVALVLGWVGFRALTDDQPEIPIRTVDWSSWAETGRADGVLLLYAPEELPPGWRATSVRYIPGNNPRWQLGMLTDNGRYVGIEESRVSVKNLVHQYVDDDAVQGDDVVIDGVTWQSWRDKGGDYALSQRIEVTDGPSQSILVVGSAPAAEIRAFAATLKNRLDG